MSNSSVLSALAGGEMGAAIRAHDWASTPLGPIKSWPAPLRSTVSLLLDSVGPIFLAWGPELTLIYNDAYRPLLGDKPAPLGRPFAEVWGEVWSDVEGLVHRTLAGEPLLLNDLPVQVNRGIGPEDAYFTFSYAPLRDEAGAVAGLFCAVVETTNAVRVGQRRDAAEAETGRRASFMQQAMTERTVERDVAREGQTSAIANAERVQLALAAGAVIGTWVWDIQTDRFTVDDAFASNFGLDQALGRTGIPLSQVVETVHPEDQARLAEAIQEAVARGGRYAHTYRVRRSDGRYYWLEANGHVEHDPNGTPLRFPGVLINMEERRALAEERDRALRDLRHLNETLEQQVAERTERLREAEEALRRTRQKEADARLAARDRLRVELADALRDLTDPGQIMATVAARVGVYFGVDQANYYVAQRDRFVVTEEWRTEKSAGMVGDHSLDAFPAAVIASMRAGQVLRVDDTGRVEGAGTFIAFGMRAVLSAPVRSQGQWAGGLHLSQTTPRAWTDEDEVLLREVAGAAWSEMQRVEATLNLRQLNETLEERVEERTEELRKSEEALRQSQKMEAVGQLTGGLAHDFNNLLAGISGSLEMMNTRIVQGRLKDVERYMVAAQGASRRAAALTHRLLAFSRRQTLAPKATDVNALTNGMMDMIQRTVGPSVMLEAVTAPDLWPTLVDPSQLENALLNLCINARDAMPGGGRITIETSNRRIDRQAARERDMPEGHYVTLCVSDNGVGMPSEVIAKAFDPFFTTKPIGQGTGLGLSMIYGFAKQSGGQVRIHSQVGEGTTVCIYLPQHRGEVETAQTLAETSPRPMAEVGETVLIVDDEPTVRMLITDVLGDLGYTAIEAADGAGGLKVLRSDARIDLLITDVGLPGGMNGRQMADAARVGRPDLNVLFITGFAENALLSNGQLEPGMSVLTKPFSVDTLATRIRELITGLGTLGARVGIRSFPEGST